MTIYLIKAILCSGIFLALYLCFLEKEKMPRFNRFYLLGSLLISFIIPLIEIETQSISLPIQIVENLSVLPDNQQVATNIVDLQTTKLDPEYFSKETVLWAVYLLVSLIFTVRFFRNLFIIIFRKNKNQSLDYQGIKLILIEHSQAPHSFFSTIFLNKNAYQNGKIATEIIEHELAHVRQKHSFDIVFFELLFAVFWFNPFLIFYGKFIRLNHEFLADEAVLERCENRTKYQYLLLHAIGLNQTMLLTSQFNYSYTKKRFKMMNIQPNEKKAIMLKVAMLPFLMIMLLLFGKIGFAQQPKAEQKVAIYSQNDASQGIVKEYEQLLKKYVIPKKAVYQPNETDRARLEFLFLSMSKEQQEKQPYIMTPPFAPFAKTTPTEAEFEAYKNGEIYGVWLNDKKIKNTELDKYKASDIFHVFISKLYLNAQKTIGYKYKYQVDLMTSEHYEAYRKAKLADKRYVLRANRVYFTNK